MSNYFILTAMVFLHIIDDYVLQAPCLCNLKQKSFWEKNAPEKLYEKDYVCALLMHGFSWAFMIMLPIAIARGFNVNINFLIMLAINASLHAEIDDSKANKLAINLCTDQTYHIEQICMTFMLYLIGAI